MSLTVSVRQNTVYICVMFNPGPLLGRRISIPRKTWMETTRLSTSVFPPVFPPVFPTDIQDLRVQTALVPRSNSHAELMHRQVLIPNYPIGMITRGAFSLGKNQNKNCETVLCSSD